MERREGKGRKGRFFMQKNCKKVIDNKGQLLALGKG